MDGARTPFPLHTEPGGMITDLNLKNGYRIKKADLGCLGEGF